jgi:hypothetical protein
MIMLRKIYCLYEQATHPMDRMDMSSRLGGPKARRNVKAKKEMEDEQVC